MQIYASQVCLVLTRAVVHEEVNLVLMLHETNLYGLLRVQSHFLWRGTSPSWRLELSCFVGQEGWGGSVGDACYLHYVGRRLCGYPVSRSASVDVVSDGGVLAQSCPSPVFPNIWGLATLTKLKTEMHICRTKIGILTLAFEPLSWYLCWWMYEDIISSVINAPLLTMILRRWCQ